MFQMELYYVCWHRWQRKLLPNSQVYSSVPYKKNQILHDWKNAIANPIFKKGNCSQSINHRSVPQTSISYNVLEHVVPSPLFNYLERNNVFHVNQCVFRKRSCDAQLLTTTNDFSKGHTNEERIDTILLNFSKTFDRVPHRDYEQPYFKLLLIKIYTFMQTEYPINKNI